MRLKFKEMYEINLFLKKFTQKKHLDILLERFFLGGLT